MLSQQLQILIDKFHDFVKEHEVDLVIMSESWERENLQLTDIIQLDNYKVISNVHQRKGRGGRPAIIANEKLFSVKDLCENNEVEVPFGVEVVWAMLTPKKVSSTSLIKKIAVAAVYSKPKSKKRQKC